MSEEALRIPMLQLEICRYFEISTEVVGRIGTHSSSPRFNLAKMGNQEKETNPASHTESGNKPDRKGEEKGQ